MKATKSIPLALVALFAFSSCASIAPAPQMTYLGNATQKMEVVGKSTHFDIGGLDASAVKYAEEYNAAIDDAFLKAPSGTTVLKNIKVMKVPNNYPNIVGLGLVLGGAALIAEGITGGFNFQNGPNYDGNRVGGGIFMAVPGLGFCMVNSYDLVVYGEPGTE